MSNSAQKSRQIRSGGNSILSKWEYAFLATRYSKHKITQCILYQLSLIHCFLPPPVEKPSFQNSQSSGYRLLRLKLSPFSFSFFFPLLLFIVVRFLDTFSKYTVKWTKTSGGWKFLYEFVFVRRMAARRGWEVVVNFYDKVKLNTKKIKAKWRWTRMKVGWYLGGWWWGGAKKSNFTRGTKRNSYINFEWEYTHCSMSKIDLVRRKNWYWIL